MPGEFRVMEGGHLFRPAPQPEGWELMTVEDARGYVWLFEAPNVRAQYVVSCDPAEGITGWDRSIMNEDDTHIDNSVVHVWRVGTRQETVKDEKGEDKVLVKPAYYQCAEFAAPVDYVETARVINALGRLYAGHSPMRQAHCIIEVYPGPGGLVLRELVQKHGYVNFYQPKYVNVLVPEGNRNTVGWQANVKTVRDLWILGKRIFDTGVAVVRSPWLIEEMRTTEPIKFLQYTSEAESGFHDDRLRTAMLAFRAIEDFMKPIIPRMTRNIKPGEKSPTWQSSDISYEKMMEEWDNF